jgi:hypothetical protein
MAFTGQTPEVLLERSDSKNPATTCKGITKLGRPCRNPLKIDPQRAEQENGVLAITSVVDDSDEEEVGAGAFFCHLHKDQAEQLVAANASASTPRRQDTRIYPLKNRSSIDTLVARLGVLEVNERVEDAGRRRKGKKPSERKSEHRHPRRVNRPPTWDRVHGPLIEVPTDLMKQGQSRPRKKKPSFWQTLCCGAADEDYVEVVRHKRRVDQRPLGSERDQVTSGLPAKARPVPSGDPSQAYSEPNSNRHVRRPSSNDPVRPVNPTSAASKTVTGSLLSYIPKNLPPQTASSLLAELAKPISPHDDEGYIYIFWLTPDSAGPAPSSVASGLLAPPTRPEQSHRTSDVLRQYSVKRTQRPNPDRQRRRPSAGQDPAEEDTILLKIGRANNVHRRMHEWTRQCGYNLSLVRFYPYVASTPSPSPHVSPRGSPAQSRRPSGQKSDTSQRPSDNMRRASSGVRKVPHARRVERLIHLELAEQRVMKQCEACGKEHREWFEVRATRDGIKAVDQVVKRWVDWAEKAGNP